MKIVELRFPPPIECPKCGKKEDLFATRSGWFCWNCLPAEDLVDEYGIKYVQPVITKKDRRDANEIRARLTGKNLPKKLGRPKKIIENINEIGKNLGRQNTDRTPKRESKIIHKTAQ